MAFSGIPVLMYHALVEHHEPYMDAVHVHTASFAQQMAWLATQQYQAISIPQLVQALQLRRPFSRAVVITFDDGYASLLQHALPILQQYDFTATLFLTTSTVGWPSYDALPEFGATAPRQDRPLTWEEVGLLQAAGWDIQGHSCFHRNHGNLGLPELQEEMAGSKVAIESALATEVSFYAFPYGKYTAAALQQLTAVGYQAGFSVHPGLVHPGQDVRRLPRLEITSDCGLEEFQRKVQSGYASASERYRSKVRDFVFQSPEFKDALQKSLGQFIN